MQYENGLFERLISSICEDIRTAKTDEDLQRVARLLVAMGTFPRKVAEELGPEVRAIYKKKVETLRGRTTGNHRHMYGALCKIFSQENDWREWNK